MTSMQQFRAFISYCHADRAFAAKLQHRLESYRLPGQLAGRLAPIAEEPSGRLGPVFRDRADLSAAGDLSHAVRAAIAASSALVVVASPDAARSHWVAREIELFRELHPQATILVALVRGEPDDALPAAIRDDGREPLAADFRREGDGYRLAFLKIVGGLAGLPLDALVQRDAQRQLRRVTAVTLGTGALVVVMGLLLVMALSARAEADHRRADAEGLVTYMLTTLRDRLKQTGNLRDMGSVNARALQYVDGRGPVTGKSVLLRALVLHAAGEDAEAAGASDEAKRTFWAAYAITRDTLLRNPADPDALFAHAQSESWLGILALNAADLPTARKHLTAYYDLAARLAAVEPNSVRSFMERGYSNGNLCEVETREKKIEKGLAYCRAALGSHREALKRAPGIDDQNTRIQLAIANRAGWLADTLTTNRQFAEARALRLEEAAIYRTLRVRERSSFELREHATWPEIGLGKIDIAEGQVARGVARLEACLRDLDRLSDILPDNTILIGERVRVNVLIAKARRDAELGDWRAYRNQAASLLAAATASGPKAGMNRYVQMLQRLDEGGK